MSPLAEFIRGLSTEQRIELASLANTTTNYLQQLAGDHKRPGPGMARRLAEGIKQIGGSIGLSDIRPDIWPSEEAA